MIEFPILLLSFILYAFIQNKVGIISVKYKQNPLPDIIHNNIPKINIGKIGDIYAVSYISFYSLYIIYNGYSNMIYEYVRIITCIIILKTISFSITILPDPSQVGHLKKGFNKVFLGGCSDLIFSSHVSLTFITLLLVRKYELLNNYLLLLYFIQAIMTFLTIASHNHYSVDVYYAYIVGYMVYSIFA